MNGIWTIKEALSQLRSKKITAVDLVEEHIDRIEKEDGVLQSYTETCFDTARAHAKKLDESGDFSAPLAGIPYSLKDVVSKKGLKNTAGSKILKDYIPPFDATVAKKLKESGAILLGKVNTDEFTMGSSCETSAFGETKNPWDISRVPGGSSGGSAAAVAKYFGLFSIGTDTGGSIRQPANFCGVTGLKVSYGRVSRYGVISYASSFDSIGPIAPTVDCCARVLEVIAGSDPQDSSTPDVSVLVYTEKTEKNTGSLSGKTIGIIPEFLEAEGLDPRIKKSFDTAVEKAKSLGAKIQEVSLPLTKYAIPTYYLLVKSEASTNLARYDGIRFGSAIPEAKTLKDQYLFTRSQGFGSEVKRSIMMGTYTLSAGYFDAYYLKAGKVRTLIQEEYKKAFSSVDALIAPVSPFLAFRRGEKIADPLSMYLADIYTVTANLAGICGLALPTECIDGIPSGIQLLGDSFTEDTILEIGNVLEQEFGFTKLREEKALAN